MLHQRIDGIAPNYVQSTFPLLWALHCAVDRDPKAAVGCIGGLGVHDHAQYNKGSPEEDSSQLLPESKRPLPFGLLARLASFIAGGFVRKQGIGRHSHNLQHGCLESDPPLVAEQHNLKLSQVPFLVPYTQYGRKSWRLARREPAPSVFQFLAVSSIRADTRRGCRVEGAQPSPLQALRCSHVIMPETTSEQHVAALQTQVANSTVAWRRLEILVCGTCPQATGVPEARWDSPADRSSPQCDMYRRFPFGIFARLFTPRSANFRQLLELCRYFPSVFLMQDVVHFQHAQSDSIIYHGGA